VDQHAFQQIAKLTFSDGASPEDCVATITRITAQSLAEAYKRWGPKEGVDEIYMGGGGSYNPNIVNYLRQQMPKTKIMLLDEVDIPAGAKEAMGFALLGCECFVGRPMIVPQKTESDTPGVVGQVQPGKNHHRIRQHVAQVSGRSIFQGIRRVYTDRSTQFWGDFPEEDIKCTTKMNLLPTLC
jgi:hypothetical protein